MKKIIALTLFAFSLSACPEKAPEAVSKSPEADPGSVSVSEILTNKKAPPYVKATPKKKKQTYTITYPNGWELKPKFMGTDTMALSLPENERDNFRENVNVVIERVPVSGRKAYYEANLKTMKTQMAGFKKVSVNEMKLASGLQATNLVYEHSMGGAEAKNRAVFIYENGAGYVITSTAKPTTFDKYNPQFEKIIQSFRLN